MDEDDREKKALRKEVRALNRKIEDLEDVIGQLQEPLRELQKAARGYYKLIDLFMRYGEISPNLVVPELKDPMARDILEVLFERDGQNISQITDALRSRRGTASRRIVRDRLHMLEENGYVEGRTERKTVHYHVSKELLKKWSQVLRFDK